MITLEFKLYEKYDLVRKLLVTINFTILIAAFYLFVSSFIDAKIHATILNFAFL